MIYVVKSLFNSDITDGLYDGFIKSVEGTKIKEDLKLIDVPGAYDIPGAVARNLNNEDCELVVTLGCVIKGETDHYHYICDAVANGIMNLTLKSSKSILFGVLTCQNKSLASDRSGNDMSSNKGYELGLMVRNILLEERNENFSNH